MSEMQQNGKWKAFEIKTTSNRSIESISESSIVNDCLKKKKIESMTDFLYDSVSRTLTGIV